MPSPETPFYPTVIDAVERQCQEDGYELIVASSAEQPELETARVSALLQWKPAGFIVIPCSSGCLARIAHGMSVDLVGRAADVMLKERRPLVMVLRETPLSLIHLRNMEQVVAAGAVVMPAAPSFYSRPATIEALIDTVVARALDRLGIANELVRRWSGLESLDE